MASAAQNSASQNTLDFTTLFSSEVMDKGKKCIQAGWTANAFPEIQTQFFIDLREIKSGTILPKA